MDIIIRNLDWERYKQNHIKEMYIQIEAYL